MAQKRTSSGTLKQGTLSFAAKRTGSASKAKGGKKSSANPSPSVKVATPTTTPDVVDDDSSSGEELPKRLTVSRGKKKQSDVFKSRESAENIEADEESQEEVVEVPVKRAKLDMKDKKWNKQYGIAREKMGHLKPIHCEGETKVHQILRVFDMSYEYGPCIGVTRLERWKRAEALGMNPPLEIREILETQDGVDHFKLREPVLHGEV